MKRAKNIEYQNEMARDYATRFIAEQYVSRGYYLHYHRNLEIYGVVKGNVNVTISGESMLLSDGQMAVIDGLENHSYEIDDEAEIFYVNIGMRYMQMFARLYPDKQLPRWLMDAKYNQCVFACVRQILGIAPEKIPELKRIGVTYELYSSIIGHYGMKDKKVPSETDNELMTEIVQYIYDHYSEHITMESLAEKFFLSPKSLSKKIAGRLHVDLRVFINDIRAQKVVQMAENPVNQGRSLEEIIGMCGFNSMRTFYRSYERNFRFHKLKKM